MGIRIAAAGFGVAFGFLLAWTQMTDPDVIRRMLLLEDAYLYLVMFSSIAVAFLGLRLLRALRFRAFLGGAPIAWTRGAPTRRGVAGSVLFGLGWGVSNTCPGPVAAQLGQGMLWSLCTIVGITVGIALHRRSQAPTPEPTYPRSLASSMRASIAE
jgi:uncharacterized membrane protein YedE/YeeE